MWCSRVVGRTFSRCHGVQGPGVHGACEEINRHPFETLCVLINKSEGPLHRVSSTGANGEFPRGTVVGIDLLRIAPLDGAHFLSNHDITNPVTHAKLLELLPCAQAHVIMSDMAPNASGFKEMDHEKLITTSLSLIDLTEKVLKTGGSLICKYWDGALAHQLQQKLSAVFCDVRTVKPKASRKESSELFVLTRSYREIK